eukprot:248725-Amphidinium_carterae.1
MVEACPWHPCLTTTYLLHSRLQVLEPSLLPAAAPSALSRCHLLSPAGAYDCVERRFHICPERLLLGGAGFPLQQIPPPTDI